MTGQQKKKPFTYYILLSLLSFIAFSGLSGGIGFIISPSGRLLVMPLSLLEGTPFNNYLIPGIILIVCFGFYPAFVFIGLIRLTHIRIFNSINIYKEKHWAWTGSLYIGIMQIIWIDIQILLIGYNDLLQFIYALLGVMIVIFALIPSVMKYYTK